MADIGLFEKNYSAHRSTFKLTSFDDSKKISLCNDESQSVINFDGILIEKYPDSNFRPKSFDAIYIYGKDIYCVEFKNQKPSSIINEDVKGKLLAGKNELTTLLSDLHIAINDYDFIYCVCYQNCIEPRDRYKCGVSKEAILFDLKQFQDNGFIKAVFTNNVNFFTKQFKKKTTKDLQC